MIDGGPRGLGDTVNFMSASSGVTVNARLHTADGLSSGHDQLFHVDEVWGTPKDDTVVGVPWVSAISGDDVVRGAREAYGLDGDDLIIGKRSLTQGDHLSGGPGADVLRGREGPDTLQGDDGANLNGSAGTDTGDGGLETDLCRGIEIKIACEGLSPVSDPGGGTTLTRLVPRRV